MSAVPLPAPADSSYRHIAVERVAPTRHVAHIDGLRAIAVLAVIVYHLNEHWLPGGFGGVDIFFVISGFVVSTSVSQWKEGGFGTFLGYFYARRLQRIAPALLACLLVTSLASALFIPPAWLSNANEMTGSHAFFGLSNYFLANNRESYFSPTIDFNPYTHTWSLGVEEQFYLLFPLLFFAWTRGPGGRRLSMALVATAIAASTAWAWHLGHIDPAAAFYPITTRLWELAAGVLLHQVLAYQHAHSNAGGAAGLWRWPLTAAALVSLGLLGFGLVTSLPRTFPWPGAWVPVVGTLGVLGFLHGQTNSFVQRVLGCAPMTYVGRLSYSLYLWHWPVFVLLRWTCGLDSTVTRVAGLALTLALAALSLRFIERPLRYSPTLRRWPRAAVVAAGLATVVASWWISTQITQARPSLSLSTVTRNSLDWYPSALPPPRESPACRIASEGAAGSFGTRVIYSRSGCPAPATKPATLFVIGDSHATAYLRLLTDHVLRTGSSIVLYHNAGCTFVSLQPEREGGICPAQARAAVDDMLARAQPDDVLFLAALRLPRLGNQFAGFDMKPTRRAFANAPRVQRTNSERDAVTLLTPIAARGVRIVLEAPKPLFRAPPFRCADWFDASNPICRTGLAMPREELLQYRQPVMESFGRIVAQLPAASVWDPFPTLCPGETCETMRDGRPLFFDGDHLSGYANTLLLPDFERFLSAFPKATPLRNSGVAQP
ncbi:MAG: acyltransferase family protein [Dokdonella sp.]